MAKARAARGKGAGTPDRADAAPRVGLRERGATVPHAPPNEAAGHAPAGRPAL